MAGLATFATEIACKCHGYTPLSTVYSNRVKLATSEIYHRAIRRDKLVSWDRLAWGGKPAIFLGDACLWFLSGLALQASPVILINFITWL